MDTNDLAPHERDVLYEALLAYADNTRLRLIGAYCPESSARRRDTALVLIQEMKL